MWGLTVCGIVSIAVFAWPKREPKYGGRYLSAWLRDYSRYQNMGDVGPGRSKAEIAVRHIGTNALPYLLKRIRYERPEWMMKVARGADKIPGPFRKWWWHGVVETHDYGSQARVGFEVLGADAAPAIPALVGMLDDRESHMPGYVLADMGRVAVAPVLQVLTNRAADVHRRAEAAWVLGLMETNASDTVEVLVGCLGDEPLVASAAAFALPDVTTNAGLVIGPLTNALASRSAELRSDVIDALAQLKRAGRPAAEAIRARLVDEDYDVRWSATNALKEILKDDGGSGGTKAVIR